MRPGADRPRHGNDGRLRRTCLATLLLLVLPACDQTPSGPCAEVLQLLESRRTELDLLIEQAESPDSEDGTAFGPDERQDIQRARDEVAEAEEEAQEDDCR
jgi:hypothetical protein